MNTSAYGRCTGILLAPRLAVTAAHCLFNPRTGRFLPPGSVHFVLGYDRGDYVFRTTARTVHMDPAQDGTRSTSGAPRDWALLELEDAAPASLPPFPLASAQPRADARLRAAGFGRDRAYALTATSECRYVARLESGLIAADCAVVPGYSGGPLVDSAGDLLGILVGTVTAGGRELTLAVPPSAWSDAGGR